MATRYVNLAVDLTAIKENRSFVLAWTNTRATVLKHWHYLRRNWREGEPRPGSRDFGIGMEPTFACVCGRVLPVYLAQADHILSQNDIPANTWFRQARVGTSPGPIRQKLTVITDENGDVERISAKYLVEYQINIAKEIKNATGKHPFLAKYGPAIGKYGVEPRTGIVRARVWNDVTNRETTEVFEFKYTRGFQISLHTKLYHAGDDVFETTIGRLLVNDLYNVQLLCGPCNASKQERSFHYYKGYTSSILRGID